MRRRALSSMSLTIGETLPLRTAYEYCFPRGSEVADGWERLSWEWPLANEVALKTIKYFGTEVATNFKPVIASVLEVAVTRYMRAAQRKDYERLYEFLLGEAQGVRALPDFRVQCDDQYWDPGEPVRLPVWIHRRNRPRTRVLTLGRRLDREKAQSVLSRILTPPALAWLSEAEAKVVRLSHG